MQLCGKLVIERQTVSHQGLLAAGTGQTLNIIGVKPSTSPNDSSTGRRMRKNLVPFRFEHSGASLSSQSIWSSNTNRVNVPRNSRRKSNRLSVNPSTRFTKSALSRWKPSGRRYSGQHSCVYSPQFFLDECSGQLRTTNSVRINDIKLFCVQVNRFRTFDAGSQRF